MANEKCVICDEAITNPICPACLERQVMYWIADLKPSLVPILKDIGRSMNTFTHNNSACIICGNNMNICAHCYCNEIHAWLIENEYIKLAKLFVERFNFELDYKFDMKAAPTKEKLGVT